MPAQYLDRPARVYWCTRMPGRRGVAITISDSTGALDPSTATAATIRHTRDGGLTWITWAVTLTPDAVAKTLKIRHMLIAGDLITRDIGVPMQLEISLTINGNAEPCDPRILTVIE